MSEIEKARERLSLDLEKMNPGSRIDSALVTTSVELLARAIARAIAREEIEAALGIDASPSPATPSLTGDPDLDARLKKSIRWFNSLSAEQQEEHLRKQRESWVRGEMGLGLDNKRATEKGGEANSPGRHERPATGLDESPPAAGASAAGDAGLADMTALARRLAENMSRAAYWADTKTLPPDDVHREMHNALAEARKHKLIE